MIPPLVRRCPECGHVGRASQFERRAALGDGSVECPVCHRRFTPLDRLWID